MTRAGVVGRRAAVVVRRVNLNADDAAMAAAAACLSPGELRRAERGTEQVRARRILVRAALRELLGELLGLPAEDVPLSARPGRPALDPRARRPDLDMSCSGSGNVGLVAIMRGGRVGVDVQQILDEDLDTSVTEGWLSAEEGAFIAALPAADRPAALTWAWVQKEAVLKGQGVGLRADMTRVRSVPPDRGHIGRWSISAVDVSAGYRACTAVRPWGLTGRLTRVRPILI
jgi:4'-phosphopantetheinyl transferase